MTVSAAEDGLPLMADKLSRAEHELELPVAVVGVAHSPWLSEMLIAPSILCLCCWARRATSAAASSSARSSSWYQRSFRAAVRSHPVAEENLESGDSVDLHTKMESTDWRELDCQNGVRSPGKGESCVQEDFSTAIGEIAMLPGAYRLEVRGRA